MKFFSSLILSLCSVLVFSQTILYQTETVSRTVQDPQTVVMAQGFHAKAGVSNSFVAKIGPATENIGGGPSDSDAGENNPSGTTVPEGKKFQDTKGIADVNGAGQFQFTVPITLPPGIKSVEPQVALVYNSGAPNGIAGYGWNISGITSISRTGKNIEKDGIMQGIQLDYSDFYSFNGQRLVLKTGEYGKDGAEYVTEKFSNIKIKSIGAITGQIWKGPEYWEVTFTDGSQAWYGSTNSGNSTARTPLEYNIVKWKDAKGNYITYTYTQDTGTNVAVISSIKWGGNESLGKAHFNEVGFNYNVKATRSIIEQSYVNDISFIQDKLLNNIVVSNATSQYRKYDIIYKSDDTKYQFVDKIQEYNSENEAANPIQFVKTENYPDSSYLNTSGWKNFYELTMTGDFRGTHSADLILYRNDSGFGPAGYYLHQHGNDSQEYYLGTENIYKNAIPINIKDNDNFAISRQGIVSCSIDAATRDLTLKYYLVDLTKPTGTNTYPNALKLVTTKVIPSNQWDENESTFPPDPYFDSQKTSDIVKLIAYDIEGDGIPEVLLEKKIFTRNRICPHIPNDLPSEEDCNTITFEDHKYIVVKQQDNTFPFFEFEFAKGEDILLGDFNGDGIDDIGRNFISSSTIIDGESVPINTFRAFNLKKNSQGNYSLSEAFSAEYSGLSSQVQIADFNGDGISDLFVRTNVNNHYIINLNTGKNFLKIPYFNDFASTESYTADKNGNYSVAKVLDINADGKSDIINFSTNYNIASSTSASTVLTIKVSENQGYLNGKVQFGSKTVTNNFDAPVIFRDIIGLRQNALYVYTPTANQKLGRVTDFSHYSNLPRSSINRIEQGGVATLISYYGEGNYKAIKNEKYPLMELGEVNSPIVSTISNQNGTKLFYYRGLIINLHNKKPIGFRQMASSSWIAGMETTKIWSGTETDPLNEGVPIKEWSIRTNDLSKIFPTDISENNTELLSFKYTTYQSDKLVNGQVTTTISDADKSKVVTSIVPKKTISKDFLTNTVTIGEVVYDNYYLPLQGITNTNNGLGIQTITYKYIHNPAGIGTDYFIGRAQSKTSIVQAYNDTKSSKEEYTYENNLLKTLKSWNSDNTGYLQESYNYDIFGNIIQKEISNSLDAQVQTTKAEYDSKGLFVVKKTDNLGLVTKIEYSDWGQITKQTDPSGNTINNVYDKWGKLLTSKNNLAGTTTYQYNKDAEYNTTLTQYDPNGNVSKKFTNKYGQEYKTSTKAFGQSKFVSRVTVYDGLGRKVRESEPYESASADSEPPYDLRWNFVDYDDTFFPVKTTTTTLGKLSLQDKKVESFIGKQVITTVSGLTTTNKEINGYGRTTSQTVDALGNIISSTDAGGTIQFSYNAAGKQTKAQYAENIVTTKYDAWGRKSEFNDPSNGLYKYEYDGFGLPKKIISPKGIKEYTYNNLGQLISQKEISTGDNGETTNKNIAFSYDDKGRLISKSGTSNGKAYGSNIVYDPQGRVLSSSENSNGKYFIQKGTTYDDKARVISYEKQIYSSGIFSKVQIENVYSPWNGELYQMKDKSSGKILWELQETNIRGQVTKAKLGAVTVNNMYDDSGFLTNMNHSSQAKADILQIHYSFDGVKGELRTRSTGGDFSINESFNYDNNNRLISWTNPKIGQSSQNTYDVKGRIMVNDQVGSMKYENPSKIYQPTGMILNAAGIQNYNNDLIQSIIYNENNDPVFIYGMKGDVAFQYGLGSMRQRVTYGGNFNNDGNGKFTKFYNEDGRFEVLIDNTTGKEKHIMYIGGTPYESSIVYMKNFDENNSSYKFLHKDYLGSILAISDEAGNKLEQRHFDAWGNFTHLQIGNGAIITDKNIIDNSLLIIDRGYTSHEHFGEVGIIHMNGRLYDPLLRRFLNADENIQAPTNTQNYNKYGYVMNNPLMYNDPSGEFIAWLIGTLVGSYLSGVQANHGNWNPVKWDWKSTQTWTSVIGGGLAGGSYASGMKSIGSIAGTKFIENSVVGFIGGALNGIATGQNIFKSAITGGIFKGGFSEINYIASNFINTYSNKKNAVPNTYGQYLSSIGVPTYGPFDIDEIVVTGKKGKKGGFGQGSYNSYMMEHAIDNLKEEWNLNQSRSILYAAEKEMFGRYAIGFTVGGTYDGVVGSLTLAYNLGDGKVALFGTYGLREGPPSYGVGFQLNAMSAYGEVNGHKFTDVFAGAEGESVVGAVSVIGGVEYSRSSNNLIFTDYGTSTRSINLGIGYDIGVSATQTVRLDENWFKRNKNWFKKYIGHRPQLD